MTDEKDVYSSADKFLQHGAFCVVIKRGKEGCLIKTTDEEIEIPAYLDTKVIDTTGAGDSFVAGFLYGLKNKWELKECARFGCAVASCIVEQMGANAENLSLNSPMKRYHEMKEK